MVFWCFNLAGDQWTIDKICSVAKSLGCESVEICGPAEWPTLKKHGLICALASNGMPGPPFMKGLNNRRYHDVGHEFIPTRDPFAGLREAVRLCDV